MKKRRRMTRPIRIFLANGPEVRFWEWEAKAFPRTVKASTARGPGTPQRATRQLRRDVSRTFGGFSLLRLTCRTAFAGREADYDHHAAKYGEHLSGFSTEAAIKIGVPTWT